MDAPVTQRVSVRLAGEQLELLPGMAIHLPLHCSLLVADVHVGKAVSFRRLGVPVPHGTTGETLGRLSALLAATGATRLIVLGDFLHAARSQTPPTLAALHAWRAAHAGVRMTLVRGNHDLRAGDPPASLGIEIVDEPLPLGALALCHHPQPRAGSYVLAGHWHPCVHVSGRARDRMRMPCFWLGDEHARPVGVLPAFGGFTGMHAIDRQVGDRVWGVTPDGLLALPEPSLPR